MNEQTEFNKDFKFDQDKEAALRQLEAMIKQGTSGKKTMKDATCLTEHDMETMYGYALSLYENQKFWDAADSFTALYILDPNDYRFPFGVGSCYYMTKRFGAAAFYFLIAAGLDEKDPVSVLHMAECFVGEGDNETALKALDQMLERAGDNPEYEHLREQADIMKQNLAA